MSRQSPVIAISEAELGLHRKPRWTRCFFGRAYPRNLHSGRPITEFVALADCAAALGLKVAPHIEVEDCLRQSVPVLKFGKTDVAEDLRLLRQYPNLTAEWNTQNLETVAEYSHHLDLGRSTWSLFLRMPEHQARLRQLFVAHGRLFIKTRTKGYSQVYAAYDEFMGALGDVSRLCEESLDVLVSEVMDIHRIRADAPDGVKMLPDEWRHHVYCGHRVASTHAFACRAPGTDHSTQASHVARAESAIEDLRGKAFATTYVLDTCTLTDGATVVVETNSFFASGIYSADAVHAIARAIAASAA